MEWISDDPHLFLILYFRIIHVLYPPAPKARKGNKNAKDIARRRRKKEPPSNPTVESFKWIVSHRNYYISIAKKTQLRGSYGAIRYDRVGQRHGGSYYDSRYDMYHTVSYCTYTEYDAGAVGNGVEDRRGVGRKKDRVGSHELRRRDGNSRSTGETGLKPRSFFSASFFCFFSQCAGPGSKQLIFRLCYLYSSAVLTFSLFYHFICPHVDMIVANKTS